MKNLVKNTPFILVLLALVTFVSCSDDTENPEPAVEAPLATFTFEVDGDNTLMVSFTDGSKDATSWTWDFGDNSGTATDQNPTYTYAEAGTYSVTLTVTNEGGSDESTKEVTVTNPAAVNLVTAGDMSDANAWTLLQLWTADDNAVNHGIVDGAMIFQNADGTAFSQSTFYQAVPVEAGITYNFSAHVKGDGITNGWFELYFMPTAPFEGMEDADFGQMQLFLKGYGENENCASSAFEGEINTVVSNGCPLPEGSGLDANGNFTLTADHIGSDGNIYIAFKAGTWDGTLGTVTMDDVSITAVN